MQCPYRKRAMSLAAVAGCEPLYTAMTLGTGRGQLSSAEILFFLTELNFTVS